MKKARILIVDDEPAARSGLEKYRLAEYGVIAKDLRK
jgi:hypothetical protein